MTSADRIVVAAIAFMYAVIPLYGTFGLLDPLRPPIPPLIGLGGTVAIALAMVAAAAVCGWGALRRPPPRLLALALLLPGAAIVPGAVLGFDPPTGAMLALIVLAMGAAGTALCGYAALPGVLRTVVGAILAAAAASALLALGLDLARDPAALFAYNNGRAVGTFLNPNELAAYLLVVLGLAAGVLLAVRARVLRGLAALALALGTIGLAATYSRWAWLSAVIGLGVFALLERRRAAWLALGVVAVVALGLAIGPGRLHHNPRDDAARVVAWETGARTFAAFPFSGVGPFAYARTYEVLRPPEAPGDEVPVAFDPHSLPLAYLAESGLCGFGALVFTWSALVRETRRALALAPQRRTLVYALAAGLVALNVHVLVNTISIYFPLGIQGVALAWALARFDVDAAAA